MTMSRVISLAAGVSLSVLFSTAAVADIPRHMPELLRSTMIQNRAP